MSEKLTCTKAVRKDAGQNSQGHTIHYHQQCGAPASEVEIRGMLTSVKAVLCDYHAEKAKEEAFVSKNGFSKNQVDWREREKGYKQIPFPGIDAK